MNPMFGKGDYNSRGVIAYDNIPRIKKSSLLCSKKTVNKQEIKTLALNKF